eukprot:CAMPEP_0177688412 /NCGR_PEP_ID=MMETSP0447-20121125/34644_1 /TAXON_ID=0 /ORGANISM="Stygamoeba regulata, Strain BSH-02190019" /LENGTH=388 /DNA_ID=CAMNT_0019198711 /DNA_START=97 /DNA_END=1263 /DNA_ORIENTATION=+
MRTDVLPLATHLWPSAEREAEWRAGLHPDAMRLLAQRRDQHTNTVVVVVADRGLSRELLSAVCNLHALEIESFVVVTTDDELTEECRKRQLPVVPAEWLLSNKDASSVSGPPQVTVDMITRFKIPIVRSILLLGVNVLLSHVDVVWLRDPRDYLLHTLHKRNSPLLFEDDGRSIFHLANTDFYLARSDVRVVLFFSDLLGEIAAIAKKSVDTETETEQSLVNRLLCGRNHPRRIDESGARCRHEFTDDDQLEKAEDEEDEHAEDEQAEDEQAEDEQEYNEEGIREQKDYVYVPPASMFVCLLEKALFPNGRNARSLWAPRGTSSAVTSTRQRLEQAGVPDAYIIHNNHIGIERRKWNRLRSLQLLFWDELTDECVRPVGFLSIREPLE